MKLDSTIHAIVTGGASGLGLATVQALKNSGVKVVIFDFDQDKADDVSKQLDVNYILCDVSSEVSVKEAFSLARNLYGQERILVNCAGTGIAKKVISRGNSHPLSEFKRILDINLVGSFHCIAESALGMSDLDPLLDDERGVIINTASVAAFDGQMGQSAYSASKGGIVGMTLPLARDLAKHGVRVNTICPGVFKTPFFDSIPTGVLAKLEEQCLFPKRLGQPEEYASLVLELCRNIMFNAAVIRIDGGIRMSK